MHPECKVQSAKTPMLPAIDEASIADVNGNIDSLLR